MIRIGLSCNSIQSDFTHEKLDGIGMYTKYLHDELIKRGEIIIPCSFASRDLPLPYLQSTLVSLLTPINLYSTLENNIDLYHSTDHQVPKLKKTPVIATLHDATMLKHPEWYHARCRTLKNKLRIKTMEWADHFITISNTMVTELVEYWKIPAEKISVIYNGISESWFEEKSPEQKQEVLKKLNLPDKFLLFNGTLQPKKNVPRLIQAFLSLPDDIQQEYPLVIVGKPGWEINESIAAIQELTTKKRGFWLNYISTDHLQVLFQCAALYVYPSLHEGFGLTLIEAFASKTPVITSNITAMPETAHNAAYLVDPYSVSEITEAIKTVLLNQSLQDELIQKGTHRARDFSWQKCAEETVKVYQKIV